MHPIELMARAYGIRGMVRHRRAPDDRDIFLAITAFDADICRSPNIGAAQRRAPADCRDQAAPPAGGGPVRHLLLREFRDDAPSGAGDAYIEKGGDAQLEDELAAYNPLIPQGSELVATVMFEIDDPVRRARSCPSSAASRTACFSKSPGRRYVESPTRPERTPAPKARHHRFSFSGFPLPQARSPAFEPPGRAWLQALTIRITGTWRCCRNRSAPRWRRISTDTGPSRRGLAARGARAFSVAAAIDPINRTAKNYSLDPSTRPAHMGRSAAGPPGHPAAASDRPTNPRGFPEC